MPDVKRPVLFCGENPAATLYAPASDRALAIVSYWHCTYSAFGGGHALVFWRDPALAAPVNSGVFTDNPPLARMLIETLTQYFPEFSAVPVMSLPHQPAQCRHHSDGRQRYTVTCSTAGGELVVEWAEPLDHKHLSWPQFPAGPRAYDLTTVICPCRHATITIAGQPLPVEVHAGDVGGLPASSAFLAFAETWTGPVTPEPSD